MFTKETDTLLHKNIPVLPQVISGRSFKHDIDDLIAMSLPVKSLAIVDDKHTAEVFGDHIFRALKGHFECTHINLDAPSATMEAAEEVRRKSSRCDALVAVGSGTINDLCKYASFKDSKPYAVFPTAASMNGYLSANASISVGGYKKTFAAHMPAAVFCDMSVIAAAPPRLNKSGLGDSLARPTAQVDWLLSHLLLGTDYNDTPFELLRPLEPHLHEQARGIAKGDIESIELLMQTLLLSGIGMTIVGGSYPASQGEHMIAHTYDMLLKRPPHTHSLTFHGEEIGVTTLTMARMQEALIRKPLTLYPLDFPKDAMPTLFGKSIAVEAAHTYKSKLERITEARPDYRFRDNAREWEAIIERIEPVMVPSAHIQAVLEAADCPQALQMLGWDTKAYETAIIYARFLRDRFTFLDIQS